MLRYSRSDPGCADSSHDGCEPGSDAVCCCHQLSLLLRGISERAVMLGAVPRHVKPGGDGAVSVSSKVDEPHVGLSRPRS
jgi:hypothetical protein